MCLFPNFIVCIGGESIATGYLRIQTYDSSYQPLGNVRARIYQTQQDTIVYQQVIMTNEQGVSPQLPLDAPQPHLSYDKEQMEKPYAPYHVELIKDGYDIEERMGIQVFPEQGSTLYVAMTPSDARQQKRNCIEIEEHSLFTGEPHA